MVCKLTPFIETVCAFIKHTNRDVLGGVPSVTVSCHKAYFHVNNLDYALLVLLLTGLN